MDYDAPASDGDRLAITVAITVAIATHATPIGPLWSAWTERGLYSLNWNEPAPLAVEAASSVPRSTRLQELEQQLQLYFRDGSVSFDNVQVDDVGWTPFTANVYRCCRGIVAGTTVTYKTLAAMAGNDQASRAVGAAMSRNRILLVIPCHRVLSGQGKLRGFSARGGLTTKRQLLDLERDGHWPTDLFADEE
ncbi:MAG: methylated-DNA--[protein]-cysteine S-methyltransferase [Rubripirellula sp.]